MTTALATLGGLFSNQSRRNVERQHIPSAVDSMALAKDSKTARRIAKQQREERLFALLNQPEVLGLIMLFGGIFVANNIPFSKDPEADKFLKAVATTGSVAVSMGHAGVGDMTGLSVATLAGGASLLGSLVDMPDVNLDSGSIPEWIYKLTNPLALFVDPFKAIT